MRDPQKLSDDETERALRMWDEYQETHDVSPLRGKAVGIDPQTGGVWFGADAREVAQNARADGVTSGLLGLRVGQGFYLRKGGSRR